MGNLLNLTYELPISDSVSDRVVRLPIYPDLKNEEVDKIIDKVNNFFEINS